MSVRIGIGVDMWANRGVALSPEALAWQTNIIANGGTITPTQLTFFDTWFFKPAITAGNILTQLDRLNIYCNLVGSEVAARTNMIKAAHFVTPVNSPTFDNTGYRSSGTGYLDLNYNPNTQGVKLIRNSAIIGYATKDPLFTTLRNGMGAISSSILLISETNAAVRIFNNSGAGSNSIATASLGIFHLGSIRQNSTNQIAQVNLGTQSFAVASTGVPSLSLYELTHNNNGVVSGNFDNKPHYASWCGSGNLDYLALRTILNNLFTAAGL